MTLRMLGLLLLVGFAASPGPELTDASFAKLRDLIRPTREETSWLEVPWQPTFWNAVLEAQRLDKPILIWAMNGHPLACT